MTHATTSALTSTYFSQRLLPEWLKALYARVQRLERDGWDINMLQLLHDDVCLLANDCERFAVAGFAEPLARLQQQLEVYVRQEALPHAPQSTHLLRQLLALVGKIQIQKPAAVTPSRDIVVPPEQLNGTGQNNGSIHFLDAALQAELADAFPLTEPSLTTNTAQVTDVLRRNFFEESEFTPQHSSVRMGGQYRICHFSDGNVLARDFDPLFEAEGHAIRVYQTLDSVLGALRLEIPHLLVLDPTFLAHAQRLMAFTQDRRTQTYKSPMLLLSFCATDNPKQQQAALRAGVDVLVTLPARIEYVLLQVRETLESSNRSHRILIVQDDDDQLRRTDDMLGEAGMQTMAIPSAFLALSQMGSFKPDLILVDLQLAECSAVEFTRMVRARESYAATPIVVLANENDLDERVRVLAAGCDAVISKPTSQPHFIAEIKAHLQRARQLSQLNALPVGMHQTRGRFGVG